MRKRSLYYLLYMTVEAYLPALFPELRPSLSILEFAKAQNIPVMPAASVNDAKVLRFVKDVGAEAVLSLRPGQIFGRDFISQAPPILNLHCTRLPDYRGMAGILQAMAAGEPSHGISVHRIETTAIDEGPLYAQAVVPALEGASLYHQTLALYAASARVVSDAIDALCRGEPFSPQGAGSLFSWPGRAPLKGLHARGRSLIAPGEFLRAPMKIDG